MNKIKSLVLTAIGLLCSISVSAEDFEVDGIYYHILSSTDMTVEVTYKGMYYHSEEEYSGSVIVPETVTYRGITYSVTSIGYCAFYGCDGLTSVEIPNSVTSIGSGAFGWCSGLTSVEIPNRVTSIGDGAFSGCSGLTSVNIPNSVTSIEDGAFSSCDGLTSIVVEDGNSVYDSREGCNAIVESSTHTLISGCKNTIIPNSVTSIGTEAFSSCDGLTSVNIPNSVTSIEKSAFEYCTNLTSVEIPNSVTSIGGDAFRSCSGLTSVVIPNSVTSIGYCAFSGCDGLTSIVVEDGNSVYDSREGCNAIVESGTHTLISGCKNTIIPNSVTSIGDGAFRDCSGLTSVEIPNSVTSIGNMAFFCCDGLTSVEIGNSVTSIGEHAFYLCSGLTSVNIPNSVTSIGKSAFHGTAWYKNQPDGVVYLDNYLLEYKGTMPSDTSIEIKDGTLLIADGAFSSCYSLTSVNIPNSVTSIGDGAFWDCDGLTSVVIGNGVTSIGYEAFRQCTGLTSVEIGNSVTSIGDHAFENCTNLTSVNIPNSVTSIGYSAFDGCDGLTSVEIPNSVTSIGNMAFFCCDGLTSVVIGNSVTSIGGAAFMGCQNLDSITSLNPTPPTMGDDYVFYQCYGATLYVPFGAKAAYSAADYWKNLANIEELAPSIYELKDGVVYAQIADTLVNALTYTRTLPNLYWNALYVPFEIPYDVIADRYDVAYINDVNGYDTDDNGTIDDLAMEIIKIKGGTLKANYPYLIKAKTAADKAMSIMVEDATLYAAEENSVRCSSVYQNYAVTGIYTKKTAEELTGKLAISTSGAWQPLAAGTALNPFRLYLSITNIDDSPLKVETSAMSRMRIVEYGETTGVETITPAQQRENVIIDLSGRRVKQPVKGGVYIVNGKKRIF